VIYAALIVIGLALLALAVAVVAVVGVFVLPEGARYTDVERFFLIATGFVAGLTALILLSSRGSWWWLIPIACYFVVLLGAKFFAIGRRDREAEKQRQWIAERRRHVEHLERQQRERTDRLGKDGVQTLNRINLAVKRIGETEAARDGWLGDISDTSFSLDLLQTEDQLNQITAFRNKIREAKQMGNLSPADLRLTKEASAAVKALELSVRERVTRVEECARRAQEIDHALRLQRQRAEDAEQRDAIRQQLAALLAGVELATADPPSHSIDAVIARVEAFHELCGSNPPATDDSRRGSDRVEQGSWTDLNGLWRRLRGLWGADA
jgi:hypothetical protein